mgnify:CR=1 FL=1
MAHSIHFIETISLSPYRIPYNCIVSKNRHYIFQQLPLYTSTTSHIVFNRLSYYLRPLILLLTITYPITYERLSYYI